MLPNANFVHWKSYLVLRITLLPQIYVNSCQAEMKIPASLQLSPLIGLNPEIPIHAWTETFQNSFTPSSISYWHSLDISNQSISFIKLLMHHVKSPLFCYGNRENNMKHAQLRMKCSKLNCLLFSLHVIDSPVYPYGYECAATNHLLHCPLFHEDRIRMLVWISLPCNFEIT